MPKKHGFKAFRTKYQSGQDGSPSNQSASNSSPRTVNERLEQLRREQTPRASLERRQEIASVATTRTVPEGLRQILHLPETAPPLPRPGTRLARSRRTPGPAPPRSWLTQSQHAPREVREEMIKEQRLRRSRPEKRERPKDFCPVAKLNLGRQSLPSRGTLVDKTLKAIAMNWEFVGQFEQLNLPLLPMRLKCALLSYLSLYGPGEGIDITTLRKLFSDEEEGSPGNEELARLDLTGLIQDDLTIRDIDKYLSSPSESSAQMEETIEELIAEDETPESPKPGYLSPKEGSSDSSNGSTWEDKADREARLPLIKGPKPSRFPNLTHISLAYAGRFASWSQLLTFSQHLKKVTHLSLSYWPIPSVTPNSKTSFVHSRHQDISFGGSNYYSVMDRDWHEAANILRRFSNNTYGLEWLDLEGCTEWLPALVWNDSSDASNDRWTNQLPPSRQPSSSVAAVFVGDLPVESSRGPNWNDSWSQITYVNVSQGYLPSDVRGVQSLPAGVIPCELLSYLREQKLPHDDDDYEHDDYESRMNRHGSVVQWLEREKDARNVKNMVRRMRASAQGLYCEFDHGWAVKAFSRGKENHG